MSAIRNIIISSARSNGLGAHTHQAEPIIRDLERAADHAVATIRTEAGRLGAPPAEVTRILIAAGLVERPTPPPAPAPVTTQASNPLRKGRKAARLAALEAFAARHGYQG